MAEHETLGTQLDQLRRTHADTLNALRERDGRIHTLERDLATMGAKYQHLKAYSVQLLWDELPAAGVDSLCALPDSSTARHEHVPAAPRSVPIDEPSHPPGSAEAFTHQDDGLANGFGMHGSIGRFALGRALGKGRHGTVFAAREFRSATAPLEHGRRAPLESGVLYFRRTENN